MENMTDYIAREALLKNFSGIDLTKCVKYGNETKEQRYRSYDTMMMYEIADAIEDAPAADVEPVRHARWVWDDNGMDWGLGAWLCGACFCRNANLPANKKINPYKWAGAKYCPHCGAKMDLRTGEDENQHEDCVYE